MTMKFVENWKEAWKWFSVQALVVLAALPLVWTALPADAKRLLPDGWEPWVLFGLALAGLIGRLVDQNRAKAIE
jgi:protein-S-isoprenylcysteine O-methyltransferase Ste14